jgi:hypothetical protein
MFPGLDIDDLASEQRQRELHADDIAWSSFIYPEGTALTGPAALQRGDRPFAFEYGFIKGQITTAGVGVLGASVKATTADSRETMVEAFSGTALLFRNNVTGAIVPGPGTTSVVNGNYSIPVPRGLYDVSIEAWSIEMRFLPTTGVTNVVVGRP